MGLAADAFRCLSPSVLRSSTVQICATFRPSAAFRGICISVLRHRGNFVYSALPTGWSCFRDFRDSRELSAQVGGSTLKPNSCASIFTARGIAVDGSRQNRRRGVGRKIHGPFRHRKRSLPEGVGISQPEQARGSIGAFRVAWPKKAPAKHGISMI